MMRLSISLRLYAIAFSVLVSASAPSSAAAQIAVVGSTVEEHTAAPGQRYEGTVLVRNLTTQPQSVRIYQNDYRFYADGTSHFDAAGSTVRSNASWIQPSATAVVVPSSSEITVGYSVTVPAQDSLRGTYWSALMIEGTPSAAPTTANRQVGIGAVVRYAVQLATHLPTTGARTVAFAGQRSLTDSTGQRLMELDVQNSGERAYRPLVWVELYDAAGALVMRREQQRGLLYPGTSVRQRFAFDALPAGSYKALVFADTGDDSVSAAQYKLTF